MSKILIAVDAGHGSNTAGKRTPPMPKNLDINKDGIVDVKKGESLREHIANVGVCIFLEKELIRNGFQVIRTGWNDDNAYDDEDVQIEKRQEIIRKNKCKYSVSVHFNALGTGDEFNSAEGVSTYIHSDKAKIKNSNKLANLVQKYLIEGTKQKNRGINTGSLGMCNCIGLGTEGSIIVELAFMTNEREATELMGNISFWEECAIEICKGICEMEGKEYINAAPPVTNRYYVVQVGSFIYKINAMIQLSRVKKAGYSDAYIVNETINGAKRYQVRVGTFAVKANAEKLLKSLKEQGFDTIIKEKE